MNALPRSAAWVLLPLVVAAALAATVAGIVPARVLVLLVLAPLVEEVVFRLGVQDSLLRRGLVAWQANALTALAFAAAHVTVRGDPGAIAVALPALLLGIVYGRSRRVGPCVALHAAMNAAWLVWGLAGTS
jgi:membrane protease YdiL (CAAX protease family)